MISPGLYRVMVLPSPILVRKAFGSKRAAAAIGLGLFWGIKAGAGSSGGDELFGHTGDRFQQGHHLTLHGLILDLAIGPQQSQAERAIEKQQAFDLPRLAVAVVEERDGYVEGSGDLLKTGGADAVDALLIFLNLLEADAQFVAKLRLRDFLLNAA